MWEKEISVKNKPSPAPSKGGAKMIIPRGARSGVKPPRAIVYPSPDETTCFKCGCFPRESPYRYPQKLTPCSTSPLTLYEVAAAVVDKLAFPEALDWSQDDVATWMSEELGLPQYMECILNNHISGMRLLMLEDPSKLPEINIHDFNHMVVISKAIRKLYSADFIQFVRSIGLPPRKPSTHCTWFKSRSGPTWGVRQNWSRCDLLRWMKILMPEPVYRNHWDLVWYQKPEFPKLMYARVAKPSSQSNIPHYKPVYTDICQEYLVPRKFKFQTGIPDEDQKIWTERRPSIPRKEKGKAKHLKPKESRLVPGEVSLAGVAGKDLILARRKMAKTKFFA